MPSVSFYVLAAEATAKIRLLEAEEIKPGENGWVQLLLDRPLAIVDGDHFIIRSTTETLGGGVIVDAHARRMPRFKPEAIEVLNVREKGSPEELIIARLEAKKWLELADLMTQIALPADDVKMIVVRFSGPWRNSADWVRVNTVFWCHLDAWNNLLSRREEGFAGVSQ